MHVTLSSLFLLSGITGLVYQVLWAKYLTLFLGSTAYAHTVVLAVFLGGLALGNSFIGRYSDKIRNQLFLYAWLEVGIGLLGILSPLLFDLFSEMYLGVAQEYRSQQTLLLVLKILLSSSIILFPAILMGGTLPALSRFTTTSLREMESKVSWLYFLNSAGAAAGAVLAGFYLIPRFGLDLSVSMTAAGNVVIGLVALLLSRRVKVAVVEKAERQETSQQKRVSSLLGEFILLVVFLSGVISLSYEIAWIRLLSLVMGASTYSFSIMLCAFITGIALGSLLVHRRIFPSIPSFTLFGLAEIGIALSILLTLPFYERLPYLFLETRRVLERGESAYTLFLGTKFLFCFGLMILPTTFLGMTLPLATRAITQSVSRVGTNVGRIYSANTAGNVAGAVLGGLVLLPLLGLKSLIELGSILNLLLGVLVIIFARELTRKRLIQVCSISILLSAAYFTLGGSWDKKILVSGSFFRAIPEQPLTFQQFRAGFRNQDLLFYQDDSNATVSITKYDSGAIVLKVNGKADASTKGDLPTQILLGQIPLLLHPDPKQVLNIGLGSGITAGSILRHPVESLDVVEISSGVVEASRFFREYHADALQDPRLHLAVDDAKSFMALSDTSYDVIISEPSNPWIAGIGNLFTVEFYEQARSKLTNQGIFAQWFHTYSMDDELVRLILRTFSSTFPHVTMWNTLKNAANDGDLLLIGSLQPTQLDFDRLSMRFSEPSIKSELERIHITSPLTLLSLQVLGVESIQYLAGEGILNRDRFPTLEYQAPRAFFVGKGSEIIYQYDERKLPRAHASLFLAKYLEKQSRELTQNEYQALAHHHRWYSDRSFYELILRNWLRDHPEDKNALRLAVDFSVKDQRLESALALLEKLMKLEPNNKDFLGFASDIAFQHYVSSRSVFSGRTSKKTLGYLERELELGLRPVWVHERLSYLFESEGQYQKALAHLEQAILLSKPGEGTPLDELYVQAAEIAGQLGDTDRLTQFIAEALKVNAKNQKAIKLLEKNT